MRSKDNPIIGVTLGDATGIGPELVVKALQNEDLRKRAVWVIIGDKRVYRQGEEIAKASLKLTDVKGMDDVVSANGNVYFLDLENLDPNAYMLGEVSIESGRITGETLKYALNLAKEKKLDSVVYAPLNKEALHRGGHHFQDELHFFASLLDCKDGFSEINVMDKLWIARVTSHIPISKVSENVTKERVGTIIRFAHNTLISAGVENPRIVVSALNPHAGDGGMIGMEEIKEIAPAVKEAKQAGIDVSGPYPADTLFLRLDKEPFDCLVSMYHDQAQTGMKLMGFNLGVTISGGLPVVLTTPAHGTAFDIAGKGLADPGATVAAMKMAVRMIGANRLVSK